MGCYNSVPDDEGDVSLQPVSPRERQHRHRPAADPDGVQVDDYVSHSAMPYITVDGIPEEVVHEAAHKIGRALFQEKYLIIGGAALILLGSKRPTADLDILVPRGTANTAAQILTQSKDFGKQAQGGRHLVWYNAKNRKHYNLDIMEPGYPGVVQEFPVADGHILNKSFMRLLAPPQLLNTKIHAWRAGNRGDKRGNDLRDIHFLLEYMEEHSLVTSTDEVPSASPDFVEDFCRDRSEFRALFGAVGL
jgi:hypothetical protein